MTNSESTSLGLAAMRTAYDALQVLDADGRSRALRWLFGALEAGVYVQLPAGPWQDRAYAAADQDEGLAAESCRRHGR
jgi:hypothetical protein